MARFAVLLALFLSIGSSVEAQVEHRDLRLTLSANLIGFTSLSFPKEDARESQTDLIVGIAEPSLRGTIPGYFALGGSYRFADKVGVGLDASFGYSRSRRDWIVAELPGRAPTRVEDAGSVGTFMVRPQLELVLHDDARLRIDGFAGLDVRFKRASFPAETGGSVLGSTRGVGPAAGLAARFFVTPTVSIDLSGVVAANFARTRYGSGQAVEHTQLALGLLFGASLWPRTP